MSAIISGRRPTGHLQDDDRSTVSIIRLIFDQGRSWWPHDIMSGFRKVEGLGFSKV